ncbi:MAG: hypothetical protein ACPL7K_02520, partial [Armatimonadota bacterium]
RERVPQGRLSLRGAAHRTRKRLTKTTLAPLSLGDFRAGRRNASRCPAGNEAGKTHLPAPKA